MAKVNFCPLLISSKFYTKRTFNWYLLLLRIPLGYDNEVGDLLAVMSSSDCLLPLSNQHLTMTGIRGKFENKNARAQDARQFLEQNERRKRTHTNAPSLPTSPSLLPSQPIQKEIYLHLTLPESIPLEFGQGPNSWNLCRTLLWLQVQNPSLVHHCHKPGIMVWSLRKRRKALLLKIHTENCAGTTG